jgi:hypothetical protein
MKSKADLRILEEEADRRKLLLKETQESKLKFRKNLTEFRQVFEK